MFGTPISNLSAMAENTTIMKLNLVMKDML